MGEARPILLTVSCSKEEEEKIFPTSLVRPYFLLNVRRSGECESILHVLRDDFSRSAAYAGNSGIGEMQLCLIPPSRLLHLIFWWFSSLYMAADIVRGVVNLCYWFGYGVGELIRDDAGVRVGGFAFNIRCRSVVVAEL
ncbi:hypothetical protein POTOM_014401 [Populus tomentosa]|uniref:Uncharacterized protein n=1 Tax=Populus tomentosa TaxID=118781 RepID=A0A8X8CZB1_POPTO|nr:hypothetical protein POTOM_014401 [Populus tomentosa]